MEFDQGLSLDDSDTNDILSYEEWVIRELTAFNTSAIANLKVGLVDYQNYESGTWFVNRW